MKGLHQSIPHSRVGTGSHQSRGLTCSHFLRKTGAAQDARLQRGCHLQLHLVRQQTMFGLGVGYRGQHSFKAFAQPGQRTLTQQGRSGQQHVTQSGHGGGQHHQVGVRQQLRQRRMAQMQSGVQ